MILNHSKTKTMIVTGKRLAKKMEIPFLEIQLNFTNLEQGPSHTLVGLTIHSQLSFDMHLEQLCTKLSQRIGVLRGSEWGTSITLNT